LERQWELNGCLCVSLQLPSALREILGRALAIQARTMEWEASLLCKYSGAPEVLAAIRSLHSTVTSCGIVAAGSSGKIDISRVIPEMLHINIRNIEWKSVASQLSAGDEQSARAEILREARTGVALDIAHDAGLWGICRMQGSSASSCCIHGRTRQRSQRLVGYLLLVSAQRRQ